LIFALYYDVAYSAEPMVDYRMHELTITTHFTQKEARVFTADGPSVLWRIKQAAERANHKAVARQCEEYIVDRYRYYMMSQIWKISPYTMTFEEYEESLHRNAIREDELARVGARVSARLGDGYCLHREFGQALQLYKRALRQDFWMPNVWAKYVLLTLRLGGLSVRARETLAALRRMMTGASKPDPLSPAKQAGS